MARSIQLSPDLVGVVDRMIAGGRYGSSDDVIAEALALLEGMERETDMHGDYKEQIARGLADIEAGRTHDVDEVFAELDDIIRRAEARRDAAE